MADDDETEEIFGVEVPKVVIGESVVLTLQGANLDKIKDRLGLNRAHKEIRCVAPPIGCGREITAGEFQGWDHLSVKEYAMSGLCKSPCQDKYFRGDESDDDPCTCMNPCCEADVGVGTINCGSKHCPVHGENAYLTGNDGPIEPDQNLIPEDLVR